MIASKSSQSSNKKVHRHPTVKEMHDKNRRMIDEIYTSGVEKDYYWYVKMMVPERHRNGPNDNGDNRIASWPGYYFPVIPLVGEAYGTSIKIVVEFFIKSNEPDTIFCPTLAHIDFLKKETPGLWYIWGEEDQLSFDYVCPTCGAIHIFNAVNTPFKPIIDCECLHD